MVESNVNAQHDEFDFLEGEGHCLELYKKLDAIEASPKNASSTASTASTNAMNVI